MRVHRNPPLVHRETSIAPTSYLRPTGKKRPASPAASSPTKRQKTIPEDPDEAIPSTEDVLVTEAPASATTKARRTALGDITLESIHQQMLEASSHVSSAAKQRDAQTTTTGSKRRASQTSSPVLSRSAAKDGPTLDRAADSLLHAWSDVDVRNIEISLTNGLRVPQIRNRFFRSVPYDQVMIKVGEVRRRLRVEKRTRKIEEMRAAKIRQEDQSNVRSSSSNEKWLESEDELLLAARLDGIELDRLWLKYFPRRRLDEIKSRAQRLMHAALRKSKPPGSQDSQTEAVLCIMSGEMRKRVEARMVQLRTVDRPEFARDHSLEAQEKKAAVNDEEQAREDARQHILKLQNKKKHYNAKERQKRRREEEALQRALEDHKLLSDYSQAYDEWVSRQSTMAVGQTDDSLQRSRTTPARAGEGHKPEPVMPSGSSIGIGKDRTPSSGMGCLLTGRRHCTHTSDDTFQNADLQVRNRARSSVRPEGWEAAKPQEIQEQSHCPSPVE